jgi:DNA-binding transcriptional ArsR family regulator
MPRLRQVQDAKVLRAMTHPLRLRLLGTLRKDGPATASELGRRFGESSGSTSYHLRRLADYGFVEEATELSHGRKKPWRADILEANRVLGRELVAEYSRWLAHWYADTPNWDRSWRAAAEGMDQWYELTPEELRAMSDEVRAVLDRYASRRTRRDGTERAIVLFHAFPERRDAA